jgi:predicted TIM-barrel fold metal-dependent hydrolase
MPHPKPTSPGPLAGGTPLVDAHCHWFSRPFFEALAQESPRTGSPDEHLRALTEATGLELPAQDDGAHRERWLDEFRRQGVQHAVVFSSHPAETPTVAAAITAAEGSLTGIAVLDPTAADAEAKAERLLGELGYRGLLLFPAQHGYRIDEPRVAPVLEALDRVGGLAYVHCGLFTVPLRDRLGFPRTAQVSLADPLFVVPAADAHPNARFVIPHFGAGYFRECLMAGAQCGNVFVDTSSSNAWVRTQPEGVDLHAVFDRTLSALGADRVLFGTDSGTWPRGWRDDRYAEQRAILETLGATAEEQAAVFGGNAVRLLGLATTRAGA